MKRFLCGLVLLAGFSALCATAGDVKPVEKIDYADVARLNISNATADAKQAVARGDRRLLSVHGFAIEVPGVKGGIAELQAKYGLHEIEGTSDATKDVRDRQLNDNARSYATKYNQTIIAETGGR